VDTLIAAGSTFDQLFVRSINEFASLFDHLLQIGREVALGLRDLFVSSMLAVYPHAFFHDIRHEEGRDKMGLRPQTNYLPFLL
jgi:hypothetical protein